jgi:hypothetical protein
LTFERALTVDGDSVKGTQTVKEDDFDDMVLEWEFTLKDGKLIGRTEFIEFDDDDKETRGWEAHTLERLAPVGLVTEGEAAEVSGDPVEALSSLTGGWSGPGGGWAVTVDGEKLGLSPVGHSDRMLVILTNDDGIFRGKATLGGGAQCDVELGFADGKLSGRSSWVAGAELGDDAVTGWAPLTFERLERKGAGPEDAANDRPQATTGDELAGVWKRDDGLYVRLRKDGAGASGLLSDKAGDAVCRLSFQLKDGVWEGLANWGDYETKWELSVTDEGLVGRAEWVDVHDGTIVARGWSGRTFVALKRIH